MGLEWCIYLHLAWNNNIKLFITQYRKFYLRI